MQREKTQRERIKALGYTLTGFAQLLADTLPTAPVAINNVTLSRALHHATDSRAERWIREQTEKLIRAEEKRRAAK